MTDLTVVARPKAACLNRQRAEISSVSGSGSSTTQTETSTTQTVEFLDGIHLMFRPFITPNKMIRMEPTRVCPPVPSRDLQNRTAPGRACRRSSRTSVSRTESIAWWIVYERTQMDREQALLGDVPLVKAAFRVVRCHRASGDHLPVDTVDHRG